MGKDELARLDATAQAELVRRGQVTPLELVEAAIERIERVNPTLNAVVLKLYDQAQATAAGPLPEGPFQGVPFLLKDLGAAQAGVRLTSGSRYLRDYVPDQDSTLVARYRRAGLVFLGKTNTPEFGLLPTTEPRLFGPCRNPWDVGRTPGGSSGGAAAAVAAGLVPAAHASDGGGSIRIPASCCGVFGLKPTRGRSSLGPRIGDAMNGLTVSHVITRSVRDSAALLDVIAGPAPGDPYFAPPPSRPFRDEVGAEPGRLRIAFTDRLAEDDPIHPDCVAAVRDAAALCEDLGHDVVEDRPQLDMPLLERAFAAVWAAGVAWGIRGAAILLGRPPRRGELEPYTRFLYRVGSRIRAADYLLAVTALQQSARTVAEFFETYDVWLMPTLAEPPLPLGTFQPKLFHPLLPMQRAGRFARFTWLFNVTGQPAMSVPLYWNEQGLPIGTQFVARYGEEATLLRLAAQLEAARPWVERRPPIHA